MDRTIAPGVFVELLAEQETEVHDVGRGGRDYLLQKLGSGAKLTTTALERIASALDDVVAMTINRAASKYDNKFVYTAGNLDGVIQLFCKYAPESECDGDHGRVCATRGPMVGARTYALRGSFFWPAFVTRVGDGVVDIEFLQWWDDQEIGSPSHVGVSVEEEVRPPEGGKDSWIMSTTTKTRFDWSYYHEADKAITLIATGAVEEDLVARGYVKSFFSARFSLGSNANGKDRWTYLLARSASIRRLGALGAKLAAIHDRECLATRLGRCGSSDKEENRWREVHDIRVDDTQLAPVLSQFSTWLKMNCSKYEKDKAAVMGKHELTASTVEHEETIDGAMIHVIIMLGLALDPLYSAFLQSSFGARVKVAPVKKAARMYNKLEDDHRNEMVPRSAANVDVIRCGITASTPEAVVADFAAVAQLEPVISICRVKNGWADDDAHSAVRASRYHYASLLVNVLFRPPNLTHGALAAKAAVLWSAYADSLPTWERTLALAARSFLVDSDIADKAVAFVAEIQLQYEPYVTFGRLKTHLHYKVVRAACPEDLLSDFQTGSRFVEGEKQHAFELALSTYRASS